MSLSMQKLMKSVWLPFQGGTHGFTYDCMDPCLLSRAVNTYGSLGLSVVSEARYTSGTTLFSFWLLQLTGL